MRLCQGSSAVPLGQIPPNYPDPRSCPWPRGTLPARLCGSAAQAARAQLRLGFDGSKSRAGGNAPSAMPSPPPRSPKTGVGSAAGHAYPGPERERAGGTSVTAPDPSMLFTARLPPAELATQHPCWGHHPHPPGSGGQQPRPPPGGAQAGGAGWPFCRRFVPKPPALVFRPGSIPCRPKADCCGCEEQDWLDSQCWSAGGAPIPEVELIGPLPPETPVGWVLPPPGAVRPLVPGWLPGRCTTTRA